MVRAVKLTLVGLQSRQLAGQLPAAGMRLPFFGIPEAIGFFTADLSGGTPQQWTLQVAHVRYLLDLEVASGTYDMGVGGDMKPLETLAMLFSFEFSKEEGGGASLFSRAAAHLEHAATRGLNIAQQSASWLARKAHRALKLSNQMSMRLNDDDTVSISVITLISLFGGLSTSMLQDFVVGKVGFSHGGLDFIYLVSDPAQPLDGNLRATMVRVASAKTGGSFDRYQPFVAASTWGGGNWHYFCKMLSMDFVGTKMASEEDVSQLFERLKVSPGAGHLSDGANSICLGQSDV